MHYVTLADLAATIRKNIWKVPHDTDFVIGIPRSGMIAASIVAEYLNTPLIDLDSFAAGAAPAGGRRSRFHRASGRSRERVLVIDDTIFHGRMMEAARAKLEPLAGRYEFIYAAVFLEGPCTDVNIWFADLRDYTENYTSFVLYEWNIFHHLPAFMDVCLYDMDGVLCVEPPDERSGSPYLDYIAHATPLYTPTVPIGEIVSYRLEKYRGVTEAWLNAQGIEHDCLTLYPADSWADRSETPAAYKARIYDSRDWAALFVESSDAQARAIHELTGRPVYSVEGNTLYD